MPLRDQALSREGKFGIVKKGKIELEVFISQAVESPHKLFI